MKLRVVKRLNKTSVAVDITQVHDVTTYSVFYVL